MDINRVEREVSPGGGVHHYRTSLGDSNTAVRGTLTFVHMVLHISDI